MSVKNNGNYYEIHGDIKINDGQLHTLTIMKNAKNICFCTKSQKKREMEIFTFCVITFEPIISKTC